jgi:hypothetical protein
MSDEPDEPTTEVKAAPPAYHRDRPSRRTRDERLEHFQHWLESKETYDAAIDAAGDIPWHFGNVDTRRELFMRRYEKPKAPANLSIPNLKDIAS